MRGPVVAALYMLSPCGTTCQRTDYTIKERHMTHSYFPTLIVAAAALSLAACSSATTQGASQNHRVIATSNTGERQADETRTNATASTVSTPPAAMLDALNAAYTDLGIEVKLWNPPAGEVGNRNFTKMFRLAGAPLSAYVGCGVTTTGAAADNYRVTMSLVSHVTPNGAGSTVESRLTAYAEDISSSKGTIACMTLGTLEARVQELALKHIGG